MNARAASVLTRRMMLAAGVTLALVVGCGGSPSPAGTRTGGPPSASSSRPATATPSGPAPPTRVARVAVIPGDGAKPFWVRLADAADPRAVVGGLLPRGGVVAGTAYLLSGAGVLVLSSGGSVATGWATHASETLAVSRPGVPGRVAWSENLVTAPPRLLVAPVSGTPVTTLRVDAGSDSRPDTWLGANRWSRDGRTLYYVRDSTGLGGYLPFFGASSLYRYSFADRSTTSLVRFARTTGCLDDLSSDGARLADHCAAGRITVTVLSTRMTSALRTPSSLAGKQVGDARFSPDGSQVAFGVGNNNPDAEQGWVAVGPVGGGTAHVAWTTGPGVQLGVIGWIDGSTLLLQTGRLNGCTAGCQSLWTLHVGDGAPTHLATGVFGALDPGTSTRSGG